MQQLLVRLRLDGLLPRKLERRSVIRPGRELCIERAALRLELPHVQAEQNDDRTDDHDRPHPVRDHGGTTRAVMSGAERGRSLT